MTRRHAVGAGLAAHQILKPSTAFGSQANSKISVALLGVGGRGTYDARIVHNDPRAVISTLCDRFPDRIETGKANLKLDNPKTFTDYEKMLASDIDAVIIATPPFEHPRMLEAAVQARKHVYCEKPAGVDVEGVKRVIAAGKKCDPKKIISFGFQQRYGGPYVDTYKKIQAGEIGEIVNARGYWISADPFVKREYPGVGKDVEEVRNWFCYRKYSGDFIVEQDCHNLDVLHWYLGGLPVKAVGYAGRKVRTSMDINDHLTLSFEWPNGMHVNFEANQLTPRGFNRVGEEFTGTKGHAATSRPRCVITTGPNKSETIDAKRDITYDAFDNFLNMIETGRTENVAERSALSTMIALLGRAAMYNPGKEQTWKSVIGI